MRTVYLKDMVKGWFVGDFEPTLYRTCDCEVAVKEYRKGDYEEEHYHKVATEITAIVEGRVRMFGNVYGKGNIIVVEPGERTDFEALEDTVNVVVKIPGVRDDKYIVEEERC